MSRYFVSMMGMGTAVAQRGPIFRWLIIALAVTLAAVLTLIGGGIDPAKAQTTPGEASPEEIVPGEILVKFKPGTRGQAIADTHRRSGGQEKEVIRGIDVRVVGVPAGQEQARVAAYERNPNVQFAEVNGLIDAVGATNDPEASKQWQYNNTSQTGGKNDADIDAFEAWGHTTGKDTVPIAILDTGIDSNHKDLAGKVTKSVNFTDSSTADDKQGHGTHVAGSAAAVTNNSLGVAGTCSGCTLYNVKVLGDSGTGATSWISDGIIWAADNGAKAINMSLGSTGSSETQRLAVDYAWGKGVILAAAAGNNKTSKLFYPAAYTNVVAVAGTDHNDARYWWSNFGSWVDVAAPGQSILSTTLGGGYGTKSGTSMASPHVAGVAGLVWSTGLCPNKPDGNPDNRCVRDRIESKADKIAGTGKYWTKGRINANNSVSPP